MSAIIKFVKKYWAEVLIGLIATVYTVIISYLCIQRNQSFNSGYDLANMADTVWQTSQGNFFDLTGDTGLISRFYIHTDLILVFLAPLYLLYSSPNLLLIVQAFAIGISVIPIFLISKKILNIPVLGIIIGIAFLINPSTLWANMYDFHPILLAIPLLFFAFYFLLIKKWLPFWIFIGLSLLTKENVGLFVAMLGILVFFKFKEKKTGILLFIVGMGVSILAIKVVMPFFSAGKEHWALGWYNFSPSGLIPRIWHDLTSVDSLKYYRDLLVPYGFLPILALPFLLPALPDIFINLTSGHADMRTLVFHYQSLTLVALTIALIMAISYLTKHRLIFRLAIISLLFFSVHQYFFYSPFSVIPGNLKLISQINDNKINFEKILEKIPKEATVASSSEVRPHVINHQLSYNLPDGVSQANYIAITNQNNDETQLIDTLKNNSNYQVLYQSEPFYLFKKKSPN